MSGCTAACRRPSPSQAHCAACHRTLGSVRDFDRHRVAGACADLASLGLVERGGLWATPEGHERREGDGARLRQSRASRGLVACADATEPVAGPVHSSKINNADLTHDRTARQPALDLGLAG